MKLYFLIAKRFLFPSKKFSSSIVNFISFVGLFIGEIQFHDPLFHKNEITLMATRNALPQEFKKIIHLMEQKKIDINQWITHSCNFDEFPDTIENWIDPEQMVIKGMISL